MRHHDTDLRADDAGEAKYLPQVLREAQVPRREYDNLVALMKAQIRRDVQDGITPVTVASYEDLHEYVDANMYGFRHRGTDREYLAVPSLRERLDYSDQRHLNVLNAAHGEVDRWLAAGGLAKSMRSRSARRR
jgi:hypothetical protein